MNKYAILTAGLISSMQAPISFAVPENPSFEERLGVISNSQASDESTNITDISLDQSIETILLMSPFQWSMPENTPSIKKSNPVHQQKSFIAQTNTVNYRADVLDFASPQLIAEEIASNQIHVENAAYIQTQATAAAVESILEANKPTNTAPLLNTDDSQEQWESLANLYSDESQSKAKAQSLPMIIQLLQWLGM